MKKFVVFTVIVIIAVLAVFIYRRFGNRTEIFNNASSNIINTTTAMTISSPAFLAGQPIPKKYSCQGEGFNPPLLFSGVPAGAKSLALIMDDPDVPKNLLPSGLFVHWVVYNMPAETSVIAENSAPPGSQGLNSGGKPSFTAPCPPDGKHRYFFKLYALDAVLNFDQPPTKDNLEAAMSGNIIGQAELMGMYNKDK